MAVQMSILRTLWSSNASASNLKSMENQKAEKTQPFSQESERNITELCATISWRAAARYEKDYYGWWLVPRPTQDHNHHQPPPAPAATETTETTATTATTTTTNHKYNNDTTCDKADNNHGNNNNHKHQEHTHTHRHQQTPCAAD